LDSLFTLFGVFTPILSHYQPCVDSRHIWSSAVTRMQDICTSVSHVTVLCLCCQRLL